MLILLNKREKHPIDHFHAKPLSMGFFKDLLLSNLYEMYRHAKYCFGENSSKGKAPSGGTGEYTCACIAQHVVGHDAAAVRLQLSGAHTGARVVAHVGHVDGLQVERLLLQLLQARVIRKHRQDETLRLEHVQGVANGGIV